MIVKLIKRINLYGVGREIPFYYLPDVQEMQFYSEYSYEHLELEISEQEFNRAVRACAPDISKLAEVLVHIYYDKIAEEKYYKMTETLVSKSR